MVEPAGQEPKRYGQKESEAAAESRRTLEIELQAALLDIQYELCGNPRGRPLKPVDEAGTTFVYEHPKPRVDVTLELDEHNEIIEFLHYAAVKVGLRKKVFVSYAHEDADVLVEIKKWLIPLEREGLIKLWDDTQIRAGDEWLTVIQSELDTARLALLLVSDSFVASEFIFESELPTILQNVESKGVRLLWVALSHCAFESLGIDRFQSLNDPQQPLEEFEGPERKAARKAELKKIYQKIETVVRN